MPGGSFSSKPMGWDIVNVPPHRLFSSRPWNVSNDPEGNCDLRTLRGIRQFAMNALEISGQYAVHFGRAEFV